MILHPSLSHAGTLIVLPMTLGVFFGYGQEEGTNRRDSLSIVGRSSDAVEEMLMGEDPTTVEALSWERQSTPVSLVGPEKSEKPTPSTPQPNGAPLRSTSRLLYIEASISQTNGLTSLPVDSLLLGSQLATVFRLRIHPGRNWDGHLVVAKQRGERFSDAAMRGSLRYSWEGGGEIVLGDYVVNVSHGLSLSGNRASMGNGARRSTRSRDFLSPFFGTGTMGFLRGGAMVLQAKAAGGVGTFALLLSRRSLAGLTREDGTVRSIDWTGYERTAKEAEKQSALHESVVGVRCSWSNRGIADVGVTWSRTTYDKRVQPESGTGFSGDRSELLGIDLVLASRFSNFSAEIARTWDGALSFVSRGELRPAIGTTCVLLVRSYGDGFSNPHASAFGRHRDGGNERGIYLGFSTLPIPGVAFDAGVDIYRHPGRSTATIFPSSGTEAGVQAILGNNGGVAVTLRLRHRRTLEERLVTSSPSKQFRRDVTSELLSISGMARIPIAAGLQLQCRASTNSHRPDCGLPSSSGSLLGVGVRWRSRFLDVECGGALFSTESYDAAVSIVEPGAARALNAITCYGSGARVALSISWKFWEGGMISSKVGSTMPGWKPSSETGIPDMHPPSLTNFVVEVSAFL